MGAGECDVARHLYRMYFTHDNGQVNGGSIPSNGKSYLFVCSRYPFPMAWDYWNEFNHSSKNHCQYFSAAYGLSQQLVSDNDSQFTSDALATLILKDKWRKTHQMCTWSCRKISANFQEIKPSNTNLSLVSFLLSYHTTPVQLVEHSSLLGKMYTELYGLFFLSMFLFKYEHQK